MKEVLVIYYTQSGQLLDIAQNLTSELGERVNVNYYKIEPEVDFDFPWNKDTFYDTFPETYLQKPIALKNTESDLLKRKYDLIILAYQVWFLTPSVPINSFLKHKVASKVLADTPVLTLIACRNMWIQAHEKVKLLLQESKAKHVGHIALVDRHINHISVLTIAHWMFSGKKSRMFGFFPKPGVSESDIAGVGKFAAPIAKSLKSGGFETLQTELVAMDAVRIKPFLVTTDERGNFLFSKWAHHIDSNGPKGSPSRNRWIKAFKYYLFFAIWIIAPLVFVVFLLSYFLRLKKMEEDKRYYSSVELRKAL